MLETNLKMSFDMNEIKVLGAYGTKARGFGTSAFHLNEKNVVDAGNLLRPLAEKSAKIENIWLTHTHLDHICDIAYILDNYYALRDVTLNILGLPETITAIKKHFLNDVIWPDFSLIPLHGSSGMSVKYIEVEYGKTYQIGEEEYIEAFKTDHTVPSCGYIYTKERDSILISADTYSLENVCKIIDSREDISSVIIECSFPSYMSRLALESKHLTPKILFNQLQCLKRENLQLYINHIKPLYLEKITKEIGEYGAKWKPIILKDEDIIKF
jgi:ribonuclease BN (tRNA processing enzyme)